MNIGGFAPRRCTPLVALVVIAGAPLLTATSCLPAAAQVVRTTASASSPPHAARAVVAPPTHETMRTVPPGPHTFYGTIAALNGPSIVLRLRNGRLLTVDATAAIANGDFSAPLFIGKIVVIDGAAQRGVFTAAHVFRLGTLDDLRADS